MTEPRELKPSEVADVAGKLANTAAAAGVEPTIVAAELDLPVATLDLSGAPARVEGKAHHDP